MNRGIVRGQRGARVASATWSVLLLAGCAQVLGFQPSESDAEGTHQAGAGPEAESGDESKVGQGGGGGLSGNAGAAAGASDTEAGAAGLGNEPETGCGDGQRELDEECDATDLGEVSCTSAPEPMASFAGGSVACSDACKHDFTGCYSVLSFAANAHVCAVLSNRRLKCWGSNLFGQLGFGDDEDSRGEEPGEMGADLPFVDLGERAVVQVAVGYAHTCVLLENNELVCWGENEWGQLGVPAAGQVVDAAQAQAVDLGQGAVKQVAAGAAHTCVLFESGRVKCWGYNLEGQLGLGDTQTRGKLSEQMGDNLPFVELGTDDVVELVAGQGHSCVRTSLGAIKCWGENWFGRLGLGSDDMARGDVPDEMGVNLPAVDLGAASAQSVVAGGFHTCALLSDGSVKCWGMGADGQLGYEDVDERGSSPEHMGDGLPAVDLGALGAGSAVGITAGYRHTCVWLTDDRFKCWGLNETGQLGLGDWDSRGDYEDTMGENLPFVDLGSGHRISSVQAGYNITCALLNAGRLKCWGFNQQGGALGAGHSNDVGVSAEQLGDALPFVEL